MKGDLGMAGTSLQIDDDYVKNMGKYFVEEGKEIETYLAEYIRILQRINANAIIRGEASEALRKYIEYAEKMTGQINSISETVRKQCEEFISDVDKADQYLF